MPKPKRGRSPADIEDYVSDGGFVDDGDEGPQKKKTKASKSIVGIAQGTKDEPFWELSSTPRNQMRATISEFKKVRSVHIRQYYEKNGKMEPGKGATLSIETYNNLLKIIPEINKALLEMGEKVEVSNPSEAESDAEAAVPIQKRVKAKSAKKNIDATSDEGEE